MSLTEEEQNYSIDKKIHFTYKKWICLLFIKKF